MKRLIYSIIFGLICFDIYAKSNNATYISPNNYLQDPWLGLPSFGGTQTLNESEVLEKQTLIQRVLQDGTWNFWGVGSAQYTGINAGYPNYAYGGNLFGQTGSLAGFSLGGLFTVLNPYFATNLNGANINSATFLPANRQIAIEQAYLEYQYSNQIQADVGLIGINNSPWLSKNYYTNMMTAAATYQGALVNVYAGSGWLLTALAFNNAQGIGETGFTKLTWYNKGYDYTGGLIASNTTSETSKNTLAAGSSYTNNSNTYNLRLWAYQFENYGQMLYADNSYLFKVSSNLNFNLAAQGGSDNSYNNGSNAISNAGFNQISSNFIGLQGGLNYKWFNLNLGYNNIWGPASAYGNGGIVSPYTYGMATDPLYTTPYMAGLVEMGTSGSAYKISPSFSFFNGNLSIAPAFTQFTTSQPQWNNTREYDLTLDYSIPQIIGLNVFAAYAYQSVPYTNNNPNGSSYVTQLFISYLY